MSTLRDRIDTLHAYAVAKEKRLLRFVTGTARLLMNVWKQLVVDQALQSAAALAFTTLLALVPLLAVSFAVLRAVVPGEALASQIREWMLNTLLADSINDVIPFIKDILGRASNGTVGLVGFSFLMITSLSLLMSVEKAFNRVWRVSAQRPMYARLTAFYSVITLAPALVGVGFIIDGWIKSHLGAFGSTVGVVLPWLLEALALTLMYKMLPHTRVMWRAALTGGLIAAIGLELTQWGFDIYVTSVFDGSVRARIYGGFGLIPIFCLWLYILWIIILSGVEMSYLAQHYRALSSAIIASRGRRKGILPPAPTAYLVARVFYEIAAHFQAPGGGLSPRDVADRLQIELDEVQPALTLLRHGGMLLKVEAEEGEQAVPARPLDQITLAALARLVKSDGYDIGELPGSTPLEEHLRAADLAADAALKITIAELLTRRSSRTGS